MMKQRELGLWRQRQRQHGPLGRMRLHAVAALWMGLAAALTASAAGAAVRPTRLAHSDRARPVVETAHGKTSGMVGRRLVAKGAVGKSAASVKSSHRNVGAAKAGTNARARRTRPSAPAYVAASTPMHRVKAEPGRNQPLKRDVSASIADRSSVAQEPKPLTVDDFTRAAEGADTGLDETEPAAGGGIYARGESHPEDADPLPGPHPAAPAAKPVPRHPVAVAKVQADSDDSTPIPTASVMRDDRVSPIARLHENDAEPAAGLLQPPTRQELTEELEQPVVLPGLYRNGRLVVPAPLKGTREILVHQNLMADDEGLERIQDDDDLRRLRAAHLLVNFTESASLRVNPELAADRRCARVWTVRFAAEIARSYYARFHEPLQVNSAVRTVAYQVRLQRTNGNAAGIDGEVASPHLTGQALDLGKRGMSVAQIAWMRSYLLPLMQAGKIDVEEEFQQACFHISVYRTYLPAAPAKRRPTPHTEVAQLHVPRVAKATSRADDSR